MRPIGGEGGDGKTARLLSPLPVYKCPLLGARLGGPPTFARTTPSPRCPLEFPGFRFQHHTHAITYTPDPPVEPIALTMRYAAVLTAFAALASVRGPRHPPPGSNSTLSQQN